MGVTFSIRFHPLKVSFKLPYSSGKFNPSREKRYTLFVIGQGQKRAISRKIDPAAIATDSQEPLQSAICNPQSENPLDALFYIQ
jgi:hypothetical protein